MLSLGKAIKMIRSARGEPLAAIAARAQIGVPFLSLVESGERQPSIATLRRISAALEIPAEVLVLLGVGSDGISLRTDDEAVSGLRSALDRVANEEEDLKKKLRGNAS